MSNSRAKSITLSAILALACVRLNAQQGAAEARLALEKLQVLGSVLMIAAHPDDENTAVLAYLAQGRMLRAGYLSLTRGEGGQNLIGAEQGDAMGVIRTQELLAARRIDGAEQFFSRAVDFGFSKSPKESIAKWGHDEILSDIVWVIRVYQPDVIVLRFSGTPMDGHGQHQASALLGKEAYEAAADPARFPEQLQFVPVWHAKRLVWNAFNFNREQEKAAETAKDRVSVDTGAYNPVLGESYGEIAGLSRSQHRSQGMGAAQRRGPSTDSFAPVLGDPAKKDLLDDVDTSWHRVEGGDAVGTLLARADAEFRDEKPQAILPILVEARTKLVALKGPWAERKLGELDHLIALCAGLWIDTTSDRFAATPGSTVKVEATLINRLGAKVTWNATDVAAFGHIDHQSEVAELKQGVPEKHTLSVSVPQDAPVSQPFWLAEPRKGDRYNIADQKLIGRAAPLPVMVATVSVDVAGAPLKLDVPVQYRYVDHVRGELTRPLEIVPPVAVDLPEPRMVFPNGKPRSVPVKLRANVANVSGDLELNAPAGWNVATAKTPFSLTAEGDEREVTFSVTPPAGVKEAGAFRVIAHVAGHDVVTGMQRIDYEHIPPQTVFHPSQGEMVPVDLSVLSRNVGYVMGAGDAVPDAIRQMGCAVTLLTEDDLLRGDLARFDAIVTGVRAYNVRADLRAAEPRLLDYVKNGGTLVVQYNVFSNFRFTGAEIPSLGPLGPYPFDLSSDRVTEEDSKVVLTDAASPLWNKPNKIGDADFNGWVQERGLYFARNWDKHYQTTLATHDAGEEELPGGMLYARYGKGAYVFTAYSWFRQLPAGVPGAYRIFANILSAGSLP